MRTLRIPLAGAVVLSLLVGSSAATIGQTETTPADSDLVAGVTPISGRMQVVSQGDEGDGGVYLGRPTYMGEEWTTLMVVDDPRLDGTVLSTHNRYAFPGTPFGPRSIMTFQQNDGGSWIGTGHGYQDPVTTGIHYQVVLEGQGGYEGLTAVLAMDQESFTTWFDVSGAIISGGLPPMPDAAPTISEPAAG